MADLSINAANVVASSTAQVTVGKAGATITQGEALYLDTATNTLKLATATGSAPAFTFAGIALNSASSGQPVSYCSLDTAGFTLGATLVSGNVIYLSANAGQLTSTFADLTTGANVVVVGVATSTTQCNLKPVQGGAK